MAANLTKKQVELIDLAEEEERDNETIKAFMKNYSKLWKFLHSRYLN